MIPDKEDEHTEFKESVTKDMMKTVVAFSNTNGGCLYIGVRDDGEIVGLDDLDSSGCKVVQLISDHVRPDVSGSVSVFPDGEHGILEVMVPEGSDKPYYLRDKGPKEGGVYIRKGPASIPAKESMIRKYFREKVGLSYESMISSEQSLTFDVAKRFFSDSGLELGTPQMTTLHMTVGESYTNLAYLLSDQCTIGIKAAVYSDELKTEFLDRAEFRGCILDQVDCAYRFVSMYNKTRSRVEGIKRIDIKEFPERSIREALLNAVVHRDYSISGDILISVFGDRISIVSLGGLPLDLDQSDLKMGVSSPRNPNLAAVFYRLGLVESYGIGIPRIMSDYRGNSEGPGFEIGVNAFKVVLPSLDLPYGGTELSDRIMDYMRKSGSVSRADVEDALGISKTKAFEELSLLVEAGIVVKTGRARSTRYELTR